jgi:arsenate reductase
MGANEPLVVYEKPTCTTCRKLMKLLREEGVQADRIDYFIEPLSREKLQALLRKMGLKPRDLLRTRENRYREMGLKDPALSDEEILDALSRYPDLIQRPIIERGERAVLGRPVEKVRDLL